MITEYWKNDSSNGEGSSRKVQCSTSENILPENAEEIFHELAEEDERLAEEMLPLVKETWPKL